MQRSECYNKNLVITLARGEQLIAVQIKPGHQVPVSFVVRGGKSFSNVFGDGIKTVFVDTFPVSFHKLTC